ncbi:MAG TPA: RNA polymerase sigma-70 factor [Cyclobacteriaceae bacterium]
MHSYHDHSDAELVTLLRGGDKCAFEAIYRRYAAELYRYARKNVPIPEDCEEMVQDVFESLWIRHESLEVESLRHYLYKSVRYMVIRYIQHKGVQHRYAEHYRIFANLYETDHTDRGDAESLRNALLKSLEGLPERCKMAIKLRITDNLSNQEVAEKMNISRRTVELYISRALCHLRATFPQPSKAT